MVWAWLGGVVVAVAGVVAVVDGLDMVHLSI
jgi:hypothetical protein